MKLASQPSVMSLLIFRKHSEQNLCDRFNNFVEALIPANLYRSFPIWIAVFVLLGWTGSSRAALVYTIDTTTQTIVANGTITGIASTVNGPFFDFDSRLGSGTSAFTFFNLPGLVSGNLTGVSGGLQVFVGQINGVGRRGIITRFQGNGLTNGSAWTLSGTGNAVDYSVASAGAITLLESLNGQTAILFDGAMINGGDVIRAEVVATPAVPEPTTVVTLSAAITGLFLWRRRRRISQA